MDVQLSPGLSINVNALRNIGNTYDQYIAIVSYNSFPENALGSTRVLPRPPGAFPRPGARR
jgi:hypothetical protein